MIPATLALAAADRERLEHLALRLYVLLYGHLDYLNYRPFKRLLGARALGIAEPHVGQLLGQLVHAGYLERGPDTGRRGREVRTYRLTVSPQPQGSGLPLRAS